MFSGTAAVIGGGSGVGRGLGLAFAEKGLSVAIGDIDEEAAQAVASQIAEAGGTAAGFRVDGTSRESIGEFADAVEKRFGPAAVLSANLGISLERVLVEASDEEWLRMLEINFLSAVRAVSVFVPQLRRADGDRGIVITGSMAGLFAPTTSAWDGSHRGIYTTTKHALLGYSEILRSELGQEGITVSLLSPATVTTNMPVTSAKFRPGSDPDDVDLSEVPEIDNGGLDPLELGRVAVTAMEAGRFVIPAPSDGFQIVRNRTAALKADFDFVAKLGL